MRKAINHLKKCDPVLRAIIERVGPFRMQYGLPQFSSLAEAIVYQQLNGKAAETIFKRFAALAGEPLTPEGILRRHRRVDRAHVPDLLAASAQCAAYGRLCRANGAEEALPQTKAAEAQGHGKDRARLGTISQRGLLVYVAQPGYQDTLASEQAQAILPVIQYPLCV